MRQIPATSLAMAAIVRTVTAIGSAITAIVTQRKIKPVSGCLVLKLVTCACFRRAVSCLSCASFLTGFGFAGCKMLI